MSERTSTRTPREIAQHEYLLLCDLQRLLGGPPTEATRQYVGSVLDCLFELLPARFDMKEEGGYLKEVTKKYPNWSDQVDALKMEHASLYEELRQLREDAHDGAAYESSVPRVLQHTTEWVEKLKQHDDEETRLSQLAMNLDVGAGD